MLRDAVKRKNIRYASNIFAFQEKLNDDSRPAPADIAILDEDQGVIRVNYKVDPYNFGDLVFPSALVAEDVPTPDPTNKKVPLSFDSVTKNRERIPQLASQHRLAVLLYGRPCVPERFPPALPRGD